jgi:small multidrug resistance family-3 protein
MVGVTFFVAAVLEVTGDAVIRKAVEKYGLVLGIIGFLLLGAYGVIVNFLSGPEKAPAVIKCFVSSQLGGYKMDFSDLLGVYVAVFATLSVLCGKYVFRDSVPRTTWLGLLIIIIGGLVIQLGPRISR